jgi:hypothetical protein
MSGSYRDPYLKRVRIVQNELNKRLNIYPFLMGDLPELNIDRLPVFRIRFQILATYADYITAVHEQDAGGKVIEVGKISETPFFDKSFVLPRGYAWQAGDNLTSKRAVLDAALTAAQSEHATTDESEAELDRITAAARDKGGEVTREEIDDEIERRREDNKEMTSYSWAHLNEFRPFELHDRYFPWVTEADLRSAVEEVP